MKIYVVISPYEVDFDEYCIGDIEAVFTDINQAAMYVISHKEEDLRIEEYEADNVTYLNNQKPKKIAMAKYYPETDFWRNEKFSYDYYCREEIIEYENVVLVSTTVPVEQSNTEAIEKLKDKYRKWKHQQKEELEDGRC